MKSLDSCFQYGLFPLPLPPRAFGKKLVRLRSCLTHITWQRLDNELEDRGRDVDALNEAGVIRAAVESVAENTVDAVVAPLFYGLIGGAPLALAYRAVNTLDSMVGYKNEHYLYFGWASARLDDLVNYVPARLCGVLIVMSAAIWGLDVRESWRILRRDSRKHASPNSGLPEAAVAGALQVQLGGKLAIRGQCLSNLT